LILISELLKIQPGVKALLQFEQLSDEEEHYEDVPDSDDEDVP
jgi:hypothetical protein